MPCKRGRHDVAELDSLRESPRHESIGQLRVTLLVGGDAAQGATHRHVGRVLRRFGGLQGGHGLADAAFDDHEAHDLFQRRRAEAVVER